MQGMGRKRAVVHALMSHDEQDADSEGSTFEQRLGIAVTGEATAILPIWNEADIEVVKREFFTLDGQQVTQLHPHEVYLMKITEKNGKIHSMKIIKD